MIESERLIDEIRKVEWELVGLENLKRMGINGNQLKSAKKELKNKLYSFRKQLREVCRKREVEYDNNKM